MRFWYWLHAQGVKAYMVFKITVGHKLPNLSQNVLVSTTGLDTQKNQRKIVNIFLPIIFRICFIFPSKIPSHWDGSFEYPQHMFWLRNEKIIFLFALLTKVLKHYISWTAQDNKWPSFSLGVDGVFDLWPLTSHYDLDFEARCLKCLLCMSTHWGGPDQGISRYKEY